MPKACAFGKVLEQKVVNLSEGFTKMEKRFESFEKKIDGRLTELFNHQSSKVPKWVLIMITILASTVTGLIVNIIK